LRLGVPGDGTFGVELDKPLAAAKPAGLVVESSGMKRDSSSSTESGSTLLSSDSTTKPLDFAACTDIP